MKIVKKILTVLAGFMATSLVLTGCGSRSSHHHRYHAKITTVKKMHRAKMNRRAKKHHVNKKDMDKSGLSTDDIKKDSRAVHQKKSIQPVD